MVAILYLNLERGVILPDVDFSCYVGYVIFDKERKPPEFITLGDLGIAVDKEEELAQQFTRIWMKAKSWK